MRISVSAWPGAGMGWRASRAGPCTRSSSASPPSRAAASASRQVFWFSLVPYNHPVRLMLYQSSKQAASISFDLLSPFRLLIKPKQLYVSHSNRRQHSTDFDILVFTIPTTTPDGILTDNFSNISYVWLIHSSKRESKDDHLRHLSQGFPEIVITFD